MKWKSRNILHYFIQMSKTYSQEKRKWTRWTNFRNFRHILQFWGLQEHAVGLPKCEFLEFFNFFFHKTDEFQMKMGNSVDFSMDISVKKYMVEVESEYAGII